MSIIYKKSGPGRLNIAQRELLTKVNELIRALPKPEQKKFKDLQVNNDKDLQELYVSLNKGEASTFELKGKNENSFKQVQPEPEVIEQIKDPTIINENPITQNSMSTPQASVPKAFNPLALAPKERSYNKTQSSGPMEDIPEPDYGEGLLNPEQGEATGEQPQPQGTPSSASQGPSPQPQPAPANDAFNELDAKEKRIATAQMVDTALDAYAFLHTIAAKYVTVDEQKIQEKIIKGELDPTITFPIDEQGNESNAVDFFQQMNAQTEQALSYDPTFGEKVRPAMIRVFEKKGWGISDEQYLLVMFGKDLAFKTSIVIGLKKQTSMMMNMFSQMKQDQIAAQTFAESNMTTVKPDKIHHPDKAPVEHEELIPEPDPTPEDIEASFEDAEVEN